MIFNNILEAMGNTPMIQLQRMVDEDSARVLVKFEGLNVGGSTKTRTACAMIEEAERQGQVTDMNIQSAADILGDDTMLVTIPDENDPELTMETVLDDVDEAPVAEDPIGEEDPADFMRSGDPDGASEAEPV